MAFRRSFVPASDPHALGVGLVAGVPGLLAVTVGLWLQSGLAESGRITFAYIAGVAVTYLGLLLLAVGGAMGLRRSRSRWLRAVFGSIVLASTLLSLFLAWRVSQSG